MDFDFSALKWRKPHIHEGSVAEESLFWTSFNILFFWFPTFYKQPNKGIPILSIKVACKLLKCTIHHTLFNFVFSFVCFQWSGSKFEFLWILILLLQLMKINLELVKEGGGSLCLIYIFYCHVSPSSQKVGSRFCQLRWHVSFLRSHYLIAFLNFVYLFVSYPISFFFFNKTMADKFLIFPNWVWCKWLCNFFRKETHRGGRELVVHLEL